MVKNQLVGRWSVPSSSKDYPLVVLATGDSPKGSHGLTWKNITTKLNQKGFGVFLFDFSGLGDSKGSYRELTLSLGRINFKGVMEYINNNGQHDKSRIGVIAASYGGNVVLLEAAKYSNIKAIGLKSPRSILVEGYELEYGSDIVKEWGLNGYHEKIGLNYKAVLDSLKHNTYLEASKITCPTRIVHGNKDSAVPIRQSRDLCRVIKNSSLLEIEGADHWYSEGDAWEVMANDLVCFMEAHV